MANQPQKPRTLLSDLPVAEQELTASEMENVQGGKTFYESRSNTAIAPSTPKSTPPPPTTTSTTTTTTNTSKP